MTFNDPTPAQLGYSIPPEWHPHAATWLSWPRPRGVSFPGRYEPVAGCFARIVRQIARHERVEINVVDGREEAAVRSRLAGHGCPLRNIRFHFIRTNECWCRDHGPAFVLRRGRGKVRAAVVDWNFNAWGRKYPDYRDDDAVPTRIARELGLSVFRPGIVMEGGSVDFNGAGTVLTTASCLLNHNRNPKLSKSQIEKRLKEYYGQKQVCWLGEGLAGDDTDGHVDDLARFVHQRTIVAAVEEDPADVNYPALRDNLDRLRKLKDPAGRPFRIVPLPMPGPVEFRGQRLPATYANFYFVNGAVLVPTYRDRRNDRLALDTLRRLLPRRRIIGIDCTDLVWGKGAIHCITQQQPKW